VQRGTVPVDMTAPGISFKPYLLFHLRISLLMKLKPTGHDVLPIMKFIATLPHIFSAVILCSMALHSSIEEIP